MAMSDEAGGSQAMRSRARRAEGMSSGIRSDAGLRQANREETLTGEREEKRLKILRGCDCHSHLAHDLELAPGIPIVVDCRIPPNPGFILVGKFE